MYQQVIIIGNVGRDPDMRYTSGGTAVCSFSVAVSRRWTDKTTNEQREKTTWFKVTAWRQLAETCSQYVKKGMQIMVIGEIDASAYVSQNGEARASLELTASTIKFLGSRGEGGSSGGYSDEGSYHQDYASDADDIPF